MKRRSPAEERWRETWELVGEPALRCLLALQPLYLTEPFAQCFEAQAR